MTMIRDALEFLANQGIKAATTKVIHPEAEPAHVYLLDGQKQFAEPAPRNSIARGEPFANLEGLIDVALEMDGGTERFTLHPVPGTIDKQITLAEGAIGETLAKEFSQDKLFYGEPFAN